MPMNVRFEKDVAVLSNFGRLMNDPRHVDAASDVRGLLDEGRRHFVLDLANLRELGDSALGLLTTLTRTIRLAGGEVVLANVSQDTGRVIEAMRMDDYWDVHASVDNAARSFAGKGEPGRARAGISPEDSEGGGPPARRVFDRASSPEHHRRKDRHR